MPNAPATESRFMRTALIGTRIDLKAKNSIMAVAPTTSATTSGNCSSNASCRSVFAAWKPVTMTSTESRPGTPAVTTPRMRRTTSMEPVNDVVSRKRTSINVVRASSER